LVKPDKYYIIDNGAKFELNDFYASLGERLEVVNFGYNLGVAGSWNKIIQNTTDIRVICNDDIEFFPDTLEILLNNFSPEMVIYPGGMPSANAFSCYVMPTWVIEKVGYFDEDISPRYAYFEDNDYHRRMILHDIPLIGIPNCRLGHAGSSTMSAFTKEQSRNHHEKFKLAEQHYVRKWGGKPGKEKYKTPYGQ
jgi:GT2 family glycosyltransferase